MESFNQALFLWINAPAQPAALPYALAMFFGEYAIWLVPAILVAGWLWGQERTREPMLEAALAAGLALLINQAISLVWMHPRPFMIGLGHMLIPHVADSSFPSDHLTSLWTVAFSFLLHPRLRRVGTALALLGLPMAWARIYLGVHYPLDMVGAAVVSAGSAWLCHRRIVQTLSAPVHRFGLAVYRVVMAPCIRRGWVNR